jgi:transcriptional regulator with XRE-family HTH domain
MPSEPNINLPKLAAHLRTKRGKRGLREVAAEIGDISASTLSRIEQGSVPDVGSFVRICSWLDMESSDFMTQSSAKPKAQDANQEADTPDVIEAHLRADRVLPQKTIDALSEMIRVAYKAANEGKLKR